MRVLCCYFTLALAFFNPSFTWLWLLEPVLHPVIYCISALESAAMLKYAVTISIWHGLKLGQSFVTRGCFEPIAAKII